jgi:hypothetical protein
MVDKVVQHTVRLLADMGQMPTASRVELPEIMVGLDARVEETVQRLTAEGQSRMVLLHGMGGIGKTTLARAVFNKLHEGHPTMPCAFVELEPETAGEQLVKRQCQLLKKLAGMDAVSLCSVEEGRQMLAQKLRGRKVLVVVDNVWGGHLRLLLPDNILELLGGGSMVLVTSRNHRAAADVRGQVAGVDMQTLPRTESLQLFCRHAYGTDTPPADEQAWAERVVATCDGLPMAVEVLGRYLSCKSKRNKFLSNMETARASVYSTGEACRKDGATLFAALRLSWSGLSAKDKEDLLDIAWFLKGREWEQVESYCEYDALDRLWRAGLVKRTKSMSYSPCKNMDSSAMVVSVHDCVVDFCKEEGGDARHLGLQSKGEGAGGWGRSGMDTLLQVRCGAL